MASFINDFAKSKASELEPKGKGKGKGAQGGNPRRKISEDTDFSSSPVVFAQCLKSAINLNPDPTKERFVPFSYFTLSAESRGKELRLTLTEEALGSSEKRNPPRHRYVLLQPGMSGDFVADTTLRTHAHLWFVPCRETATNKGKRSNGTTSAQAKKGGKERGILQFVDPRRYGRWRFSETPVWGADRSPDPVKEYSDFRNGLFRFFDCERDTDEQQGKTQIATADKLSRVQLSRRELPVCEWMADQRYFNGVGNIYRCEILHRCNIPPLAKCGHVFFTGAKRGPKATKNASLVTKEGGELDREKLNHLCEMTHQVLSEALNMKFSYLNELAEGPARSRFENWLQVYGKGKNLVDSKGRTIWFHGEAGGPGGERDERGKARSRQATERERRAGGGKRTISASKAAKKGPRRPVKAAPAKKRPAKPWNPTVRAPAPPTSRKRAREEND